MTKQKTTNEYAEEITDCIFSCNLTYKETREYLEKILVEIVSDAKIEFNFKLYSVFQRI